MKKKLTIFSPSELLALTNDYTFGNSLADKLHKLLKEEIEAGQKHFDVLFSEAPFEVNVRIHRVAQILSLGAYPKEEIDAVISGFIEKWTIKLPENDEYCHVFMLS